MVLIIIKLSIKGEFVSRVVVIDTETTGGKYLDGHRIIELAAVEIIDFLSGYT